MENFAACCTFESKVSVENTTHTWQRREMKDLSQIYKIKLVCDFRNNTHVLNNVLNERIDYGKYFK